jgi:pyruvate/2-oxoglutarate dehydrogenase complex dihydrolipoamide acyltransferase (E2) component
MIEKIVLPRFDANITEATVGRWHRKQGDRLEKGDLLVEVITDKANFELTAQAPGTLRRIIAPEKSQVPLGYVLALAGDASEELPDVSAENARLMREYRSSATGKVVGAPAGEPREASQEEEKRAERVRATPRARRLAREHGIDLSEVRPRGPDGVVTEKEVRRFVEEKGHDDGNPEMA